MKQMINGQLVSMTESEIQEYNAKNKIFQDNISNEKLNIIKDIRLQKLKETDYLALSDNTMSDEMKNFRQSMRDVPQNFDEDKYDELLAKNDNGDLTHTVWIKP